MQFTTTKPFNRHLKCDANLTLWRIFDIVTSLARRGFVCMTCVLSSYCGSVWLTWFWSVLSSCESELLYSEASVLTSARRLMRVGDTWYCCELVVDAPAVSACWECLDRHHRQHWTVSMMSDELCVRWYTPACHTPACQHTRMHVRQTEMLCLTSIVQCLAGSAVQERNCGGNCYMRDVSQCGSTEETPNNRPHSSLT